MKIAIISCTNTKNAHLHETSWCNSKLVENIRGYAQYRRRRQRVSDLQTPLRVLVLRPQHFLVVEQREDEDGQEEERADVLPADAPENPRPVAEHLLHVAREVVGAVEPADAGCLHEYHEEDGQTRAVDVHHVDEVHATLWMMTEF